MAMGVFVIEELVELLEVVLKNLFRPSQAGGVGLTIVRLVDNLIVVIIVVVVILDLHALIN